MIAHHRRNADWASRRSRTGVLEPQPLPPFAQASGGHSLRVRSVGAWTKRPQRTRIGGQQKPRRTGRGKRRGGAERGAWGLDGKLGEAWGQPSPAPFRRILLRRRPGCGEIVAV